MGERIPNPDAQLAAQQFDAQLVARQQMQDAEALRRGSEKNSEDILEQMGRIRTAIGGKAMDGFDHGSDDDHLKLYEHIDGDYSIQHDRVTDNGDKTRTSATSGGVAESVGTSDGESGVDIRTIKVAVEDLDEPKHLKGEMSKAHATKFESGSHSKETAPLNRKQSIGHAARILRSLDNEVTKRKDMASPETNTELDDI